ncbi:MAG: hypothetical protein JWO58_1133 [Chitinophagaceae bacterium]|nr:hypothetical protein [Chitinophagaceae bacterium]
MIDAMGSLVYNTFIYLQGKVPFRGFRGKTVSFLFSIQNNLTDH